MRTHARASAPTRKVQRAKVFAFFSGEAMPELVLTVTGMACGGCSGAVEKIIKDFDGVVEVKAEPTPANKVTITGEGELAPPLARAGWRCHYGDPNPNPNARPNPNPNSAHFSWAREGEGLVRERAP